MLQTRPVIRRKSTNISLDAALAAEAKSLGINISRAAEEGIARVVADEKARRWKIENSEAIDDLNAWVEQHGVPLEEFRQF